MGKNTIFVQFDRSRHEAFEKCPRLRFLAYEYPVDLSSIVELPESAADTGLTKKAHAIPLLTGGMVHRAIEFFLTSYGEDAAVENALQAYDAEIAARDIDPDELVKDKQTVISVQRLLIEALVRGWIRYVWPRIQEEFEIIEVEHEESYRVRDEKQDVDYELLARTDVLIQHKETGHIYVRNFKTASEATERRIQQFKYDTQTISEVIACEQRLRQDNPEIKLAGVIYDLLIKGPRKVEYPRGSSTYHNTSPLIWCYMKEGQTGITGDEIASRWEYECTGRHKMGNGHWCEGGKEHRLGKGWSRHLITDVFPNGVLDWFAWLQENDPQLILDQFVTIPAIERTDFDVATWHRGVLNEELRIHDAAELARAVIATNDGSYINSLPQLDTIFPKHTHNGNCIFPSKCPMFDLCWGAASSLDNPLDSELYTVRVANHPEQAVVTE